ncbi:MAG: hypothetical protein KC912_24200 [Proteobacteria bacterium]|nr:hypothetical protein [Pseudomonadota bacterium]
MSGTFGDLLKGVGLEASEPESAEESPAATEPAPAPESEVTYARKMVIRMSKKGHRGKTVTQIDGIVSGHKAVLKRLKRELGSGGRIDGDTLIMQGSQVERIARWFESQGVVQVVRS